MARQVGTSSAEGQARHRARKSGKSLVSRMVRRTFAEVEPEVIHTCDLPGRVTDMRVLSDRSLLVTFNIPVEYAHEAMDMTIESKSTFTFLRVYQVPIPLFLEEEEEVGGDALNEGEQ